MSLLRCDNCTTLYAVGVPHCPHCGGTDHNPADPPPEPKTNLRKTLKPST